MDRIIYTTFATAMRHRPEDLAASGGLQTLGSSRPRERRARAGLVAVRRWLSVALAWEWPRRQRNDRSSSSSRRVAETTG